MPAIAVTEHGNMFSSVVFHDAPVVSTHPGMRGLRGAWAIGGRRGVPGETQNHLVLLAETLEGYRNLIKLVSSGYTEGFYYKPRIDKELLAQHLGRSDWPEQPEGRGRRGLRTIRRRRRSRRRRLTVTFSARQSSSRCGGTASKSSAPSTAVFPPSHAKDLNLPLVCTNDVHYLRDTDAHAHDVLLCIGTGKGFNDPKRLRYDANQFFLQDRRRDGGDLQGLSGRRRQHDAHRRATANVKLPSGENFLPISTCLRGHGRRATSTTSRAKGFAERLPRLQQLKAQGLLRHTIDECERRLDYELAMIKKMGPGTS